VMFHTVYVSQFGFSVSWVHPPFLFQCLASLYECVRL
jgi:hypothetical protein